MIWTRRNILAAGARGVAAIAAGGLSMPSSALSATAQGEAIEHPVLGDAKASKRLVVWGSCTCPFTAGLYGVLNNIIRDMPKVVSVEWRHFPVHDQDPSLHVAALGFKGVHFWEFVTQLLQKAGAPLTPEMLPEFAKKAGGSEETLRAAYADPAKWNAVKQDLLAGHLLGVTKTPGLFYNGYFLTPEGLPADRKAFDASLRSMLKQS